MFANVHTNRAFTQQEMNDMNQKRQLLDNLYRIRESSQSRALADEERKQKIEALKQVGEESKRKQQEAQTAKRNQVPSTYVLEQMGQNPFVSGGYMIDSSGRRIEVPKYGTVTPAMYQKLGQSVIEGKPAPSPSDFVQNTPYSQTQQRIERATQQGDYGKASMLAQQQINNLAQIAAMPGLTDEAKQILNANMVSLANQAKNNAGIYQEQIKAKALAQKVALDNQNKMEIERLKSDPKFQKLDQQTQSTIMKIYSDNFHKEVEVPVWDSTKNKWATTLEGKSVTEKRRIIELSPQQVEYLTGRKISAKDYATENYKAQLQMFGIQPTEVPMPTPNVAPQGAQVNLSQAEKTTIAFQALKAIHQANVPTEKVLKDLSTEEGRKAYQQQFPGIDLNNLVAALNSSPDSNIQLQTMNKLLQSAKSKGEKNASVIVNKKSSNKTSINNKKTTTIDSSMPQIDLSLIPNTFSSIRELGLQAKKISPEISSNISYLANILPQKEQYKLSPKGARTLRSMMDSVTLNQVLNEPSIEEEKIPQTNLYDIYDAINEANAINRGRVTGMLPAGQESIPQSQVPLIPLLDLILFAANNNLIPKNTLLNLSPIGGTKQRSIEEINTPKRHLSVYE